MKEVLIHVEDCAYEKFMGMLSLCPQVEVVSEGVAIETREAIDLCVARAIREMRADGAFRFPISGHYAGDAKASRKRPACPMDHTSTAERRDGGYVRPCKGREFRIRLSLDLVGGHAQACHGGQFLQGQHHHRAKAADRESLSQVEPMAQEQVSL